jgi:hypothetical protein
MIRCISSGKYFHDGSWTQDPSQAEHFPDAGKAIEACLRHRFTDVELVIQLNSEAAGVFDTRVRLFDYSHSE